MKTYWNGEECKAEKVKVIVGKPARPTWWCAHLEGKQIDAIKVTQGKQHFFIPDEQQSWTKLTVGMGSPSYPHKGLSNCTLVTENNPPEIEDV